MPGAVVVLPTYNEAGNILHTLDRLMDSTQADVLVVDDDSPDGTAQLVETFQPRVHLLVRRVKSGLVDGFNNRAQQVDLTTDTPKIQALRRQRAAQLATQRETDGRVFLEKAAALPDMFEDFLQRHGGAFRRGGHLLGLRRGAGRRLRGCRFLGHRSCAQCWQSR